MNLSDKVKSVLKVSGLNQNALAENFGMTKQTMSNKMSRESWSAGDLIRVANLVGGKLAFVLPDGTTIYFDPEDATNRKSAGE